MDRHVVMIEEKGVVDKQIAVFPRRGARLKLDVNDLLQRFAKAQNKPFS